MGVMIGLENCADPVKDLPPMRVLDEPPTPRAYMDFSTLSNDDLIILLMEVDEIRPEDVLTSPPWRLDPAGVLYSSTEDPVVINMMALCEHASNRFLLLALDGGAEKWLGLNAWVAPLWSKWINVRWGRDYRDGPVLPGFPNLSGC